MTRTFRIVVAFVVFAGIGLGVPLVERWLVCVKPVSEACVWAKAYLPLAVGLWCVAGAIAATVTFFVLSRFTRE